LKRAIGSREEGSIGFWKVTLIPDFFIILLMEEEERD
jgi:hypothetical protein